MDNKKFLEEQIITYLGNKRTLLNNIALEVEKIMTEIGKEKGNICDLFSGSGIVSRRLKQYSENLYANDLEKYSKVINSCYLTNKKDFNEKLYDEYYKQIMAEPLIEGVITHNYAPKDDDNIVKGERVFYTHINAMRIDTIRTAIDKFVPDDFKKYFLAPLLYEASVHVNTSGVFKGFYTSSETKLGKFGGNKGNALKRIKGDIELKKPIFSDYDCNVHLFTENANDCVKHLKDLDIVYLDPPYNQHPYGSNYFMLNTILENKTSESLSRVAGIPKEWNRSKYNQKKEALNEFDKLIKDLDTKYALISYNNEGFINYDDMCTMLEKYGEVKTESIEYTAFRASRNLQNRDKHTTEFLFVLKKN